MDPYRQAARGAHVDFAAPGVNLWTAASISGGRLRSGTSYAAPFVTAALAAVRLRSPGRPLADAVADLTRCAVDRGQAGHDEIFGHGIVSSSDQCLAASPLTGDEDFRLSGE
jgi:subtilisin family serine protease